MNARRRFIIMNIHNNFFPPPNECELIFPSVDFLRKLFN